MAFQMHAMREISRGPAAKQWALGMADQDKLLDLYVRGYDSVCDCPMDNKCDSCQFDFHIRLKIIGAFNPDLSHDTFIFWGLAAIDPYRLRGNLRPDRNKQASNIPEGSIMVQGFYRPKDTNRGWMGPCSHDLQALFELFCHTDKIKRNFPITQDELDVPMGQGILPPELLFWFLQHQKPIHLRLRNTRDDVIGTGKIMLKSAEPMGSCQVLWKLKLVHERECQHPCSDTHEDATLMVSPNGEWEQIFSDSTGVHTKFVLATE